MRQIQQFLRLALLLSVANTLFLSCNTEPGKIGKNDGVDSLSYVFKSGKEGYNCFRIPAIVRTNSGLLLAFAEGRKNGCSDTGQIDMVMKKSSDQGDSWSNINIVTSTEGYTSGNPAPIIDRSNGRVHLLLTQNLGEDAEHEIIDGTSQDTRRIFHLYSDDEGTTWTEPNEITQDVKEPDWTWYATGPGSGIQLQSEEFNGRLMVGCDHIEAETKHYYSHVIYSDDGGNNWNLGGSTPQHQVNECEVVELEDGSLLLNMRNYDRSSRTRKISRSVDGGISWSDIAPDSALIEPICQASLHKHKAKDKDIIFFSNPANDSARTSMTIKWSLDDGTNWEGNLPVHAGPSAYSDLVSVSNSSIGLLYEGGYNNPYEGIAFRRIALNEFVNR